jgi:hypothetical protein
VRAGRVEAVAAAGWTVAAAGWVVAGGARLAGWPRSAASFGALPPRGAPACGVVSIAFAMSFSSAGIAFR